MFSAKGRKFLGPGGRHGRRVVGIWGRCNRKNKEELVDEAIRMETTNPRCFMLLARLRT